MNAQRVVRHKLNLEIKYLAAERDREGRVIHSGILVSKAHLKNGLQIDVSNDPIFDEDEDRLVDSGKYQINVRGTRKAFQELATILLTLAHYEEDPSYHIHIDDIQDSEG